jgi:hypothetical protein
LDVAVELGLNEEPSLLTAVGLSEHQVGAQPAGIGEAVLAQHFGVARGRRQGARGRLIPKVEVLLAALCGQLQLAVEQAKRSALPATCLEGVDDGEGAHSSSNRVGLSRVTIAVDSMRFRSSARSSWAMRER